MNTEKRIYHEDKMTDRGQGDMEKIYTPTFVMKDGTQRKNRNHSKTVGCLWT